MTDVNFPTRRPATRQALEFEISRLAGMLQELAAQITQREQALIDLTILKGDVPDLALIVNLTVEKLASASTDWAEISHAVKKWRP